MLHERVHDPHPPQPILPTVMAKSGKQAGPPPQFLPDLLPLSRFLPQSRHDRPDPLKPFPVGLRFAPVVEGAIGQVAQFIVLEDVPSEGFRAGTEEGLEETFPEVDRLVAEAGVAEGGVVCNYGSMTGEDPVMSRSGLIFGGQRLVGFMLGRALGTRSLAEVRALYADLGRQILGGALSAPVEAVYPIEDIKAALKHAQQGERRGKILVAPNGPV